MDEKWSKVLGIDVGESYWSSVHTLEELLDKKRANSPEDWASIYMQDPVVTEGNIFKSSMFRSWDHSEPPGNIKFILVSLDTAFSTKSSADYSAFTVWGIFERIEPIKFGLHAGKETKINHMILLEFQKGRWNFPELCDKLQEIHEAYSPDTYLIENKGSGMSLIQELQRRSWPITPYHPSTDKVTRAHQATPVLSSGRLWVNKKLKNTNELIQECLSFPNAAHDDALDSLVQAVNWFRDSYTLSTPYDTEEQEVEDTSYKPARNSYWGLVSGHV
jgi:predicted phage terminase large subunit-like protein